MSTWNNRIYYFTDKTQTKLERIWVERKSQWNSMVSEIETDKNISCLFTNELRMPLSTSEEDFNISKKRVLRIINSYYKRLFY